MRHLKTLASALAIVAVLVMATDYIAMAATGKPLILGQVNKSGKTTTIQSSKGAALKLKVDSDKPPLKVNSSTMVKKLNAAKVGGMSASQLGIQTSVQEFKFTANDVTSVTAVLQTPSPGTYEVHYQAWMYTNPATDGYCQLHLDSATRAPTSVIVPTGGFFIAESSSLITVTATTELDIECSFNAITDVTTYQNGFAWFNKVTSLTGEDLPAGRLAAKSGSKAANK